MVPQFLPWAAQVVGVQGVGAQTLGVPPAPQVSPGPQVPHESTELQPSLMVPQSFPWAVQVVGVQLPVPHTLEVPLPPQVCPEPQLPQLTLPPQPSGTLPQFWPGPQEVAGTQGSEPPSGVSTVADSTVPWHARHSRTAKHAMRVIVCGMSRHASMDKVHIGAPR